MKRGADSRLPNIKSLEKHAKMVNNNKIHVETRNIGKHFGGTHALSDINIKIISGTIHALVGENGAGKSTLGKIIAGVYPPDEGELWVNGRKVNYRSPKEAIDDGIIIIAQEICLQPYRSVIENIFLGNEKTHFGILDKKNLYQRYEELTKSSGIFISPDLKVKDLRVATQQQVEILRALARNTQLIIMDEPTAALTFDEAQKLFNNIRILKDNGKTIIYVSHFLKEVLSLSDTVTVLRNGKVTKTGKTKNETPDSLVTDMVGHPMDVSFPPKVFPPTNNPILLSVKGLTRDSIFEDISFDIRQGEILGLAGLIGSGRTEICRAIFGADPIDGGKIELKGIPVHVRTPHEAIKIGIALLPESRKDQGLLIRRSIIDNVTLPHLEYISTFGVIDKKQESQNVEKLMKSLDVRASHLGAPMWTLSGGNQQKVLFGKWLFNKPMLLIADEPTRGIDIAAKIAIYEVISSLAKNGMAVLLVSSELEEVIGLSHRIIAINNGHIIEEFEPSQMNIDKILRAVFCTSINSETQKRSKVPNA